MALSPCPPALPLSSPGLTAVLAIAHPPSSPLLCPVPCSPAPSSPPPSALLVPARPPLPLGCSNRFWALDLDDSSSDSVGDGSSWAMVWPAVVPFPVLVSGRARKFVPGGHVALCRQLRRTLAGPRWFIGAIDLVSSSSSHRPPVCWVRCWIFRPLRPLLLLFGRQPP